MFISLEELELMEASQLLALHLDLKSIMQIVLFQELSASQYKAETQAM